MLKNSIYIKWVTVAVLVIIVVLWGSYFSECLFIAQRHYFQESNNSLVFLKWISGFLKGSLFIHLNLFDGEFYLRSFSMVILSFETFFVALLIIGGIIIKGKRKLYIIILIVSLLLFYGLFEFLSGTLQLFVPG